MDLKALMQKLETINTKQIVNESVETKKVITESVAEPVRKSADPVFKGSIARSLAEEFGYDLDEAEVTSGSGAPVTSGSGAPVQTGTTPPPAAPAAGASPWANDPAKDAAWKALSPEDQKWLGGADPTDPYILARAPNKGKPAKRATGAVLDPNGPTGGTTPAPAAPAAPAAVDPAVAATREKFKALMDKLEKTGGVSGSAPAPAAPTAPKKPTQIAPQPKPATGAGTKPAGGATMPAVDTMGNVTGVQENVSFEDDQTLLAIKNIRY